MTLDLLMREHALRPGEILCQGETPLGFGNGIKIKNSIPHG